MFLNNLLFVAFIIFLLQCIHTAFGDVSIAVDGVDIDTENVSPKPGPPLRQDDALEQMTFTDIDDSVLFFPNLSNTNITMVTPPYGFKYKLNQGRLDFGETIDNTSGLLYNGQGTALTINTYWVLYDLPNDLSYVSMPEEVVVLRKPMRIQNNDATYDIPLNNAIKSITTDGSYTTIQSWDIEYLYTPEESDFLYSYNGTVPINATGRNGQCPEKTIMATVIVLPETSYNYISSETFNSLHQIKGRDGQLLNSTFVFAFEKPNIPIYITQNQFPS